MIIKKLLLLLLFSFNLLVSAQGGGQIRIDDFVSVRLPGKAIMLDTVIEGIPTTQKYSVVGNAAYFISKMKIGSKVTMPYDEESLYDVYRGGAKGFIHGLRRRNFTISDSAKIKMGNLKAYHVKAQADHKKTAESKLIVLGDWLYMVHYINVVDFNESDKDAFLNSIAIAANSPDQYSGNSPNAELGYSLLKLIGGGLVVAGLIYITRKVQEIEKNKNKMA